MRLFHHFSCLNTKESYDRWITRRVWGFRQQISKTKYLKMSVGNMRKLQEKFRCTIYWEKNSSDKRYQRIRTCLTGEVETSSSPIRLWDIRMWNIRLEDPNMSDRGSWNVILSHPAVRYPDVKCRRTEFRMWNVGARNSSPGGLSYAAQGGPFACARCGTPFPDDTECAWLSRSTPFGFPKRTCGTLPYPDSLREKHTTLVNITPGR